MRRRGRHYDAWMDDAGASDAPDLRDYGRTLWRHRFLIVATVAIAVGAALAFSFTQTRVYRATADLLIQPNAIQQLLNPTNQNAQNPQFDARNVDTEVAVLQSKIVQDAAKHQLGHTPDVSISSNSATSDVVSVNAQSTNARVAAADANGYADVYVALRQQQTKGDLLQAAAQVQAKISQIDVGLPSLPVGSPAFTTTENQRATLQQELNQLQVAANLNQVGGAQLLARADVPTSPVASQILRDTAIALVLGLLVGVGLAFLRDYVDDKIRSREDLERAAPSLPLLGQLPRQPEWRHRNVSYLVSADTPTSPGAEAYRKLRTSIQFLAVDEEFRSIQITSSEPGEGKTTILANLAVAFARAGQRVTILCCDLRRPRIHEFFGLPNDVGFTSLLLGEASLFEARQAVPLYRIRGALRRAASAKSCRIALHWKRQRDAHLHREGFRPGACRLLAGPAGQRRAHREQDGRRHGAGRQREFVIPPGSAQVDRAPPSGRRAAGRHRAQQQQDLRNVWLWVRIL